MSTASRLSGSLSAKGCCLLTTLLSGGMLSWRARSPWSGAHHRGLEAWRCMGNLALRDWGHARDYVEIQWRMLQQEQPEDFVIATGREKSVRRFIELAPSELGWGGSSGRAKASRKPAPAPTPAIWWCASTRATSARRRWKLCWATPPKPAKSWAGRPPAAGGPVPLAALQDRSR